MDAYEFVRQALVVPAVRVAQGARPFSAIDADAALKSRLGELLDRFVLTRGAATDLLNAERARHAFAHYFHTGSELLDLRNALRYYLVLLDCIDREMSAQHKMSRRIDQTLLGLPRRGSHPLIAMSTQWLGLGVLGVVERRGDSLRHHPLAAGLETLRVGAALLDVAAIAAEHATRWIIDSRNVGSWHGTLSTTGPASRYTRSILFDLQFVLEDSAVPGMAQWLRPLYAAVDEQALRRMLFGHYDATDPEFSAELRRMFAKYPDVFAGPRLRSLVNSLYYAWYLAERGLDPRLELPHAAMAALGALRSPRRSGPSKSSRRSPQPTRPRAKARSPVALPLLEKLLPAAASSRRGPA
jgi:hypothetical protein